MSDFKRWTLLSLLNPDFVDNIKQCVVFGSAGCEALIQTKEDELYGLGTNFSCCLGIPSIGSFTPTRIELLSKKRIKEISYGSGPHILALSENGEVFSWGHNAFGQLGLGHSSQSPSPVLVTGALTGERVVQVSCGGHHSAALTDRGELYTWGLNSSGQLGIGSNVNQDNPRAVSLHNRFLKSVSCGHNFTMVLTESGDVYTWGFNENGQIGSGNLSNQHTPYFLEGLSKVAVINQIACGYAHSLALSDEGLLYVWGSNSCGQLGGNLLRKNLSEPVQAVKDLGRISEIAAIHLCNITVVVNKAGKVFMWGHVRGQSVSQPIETRFTCVDDAFACFASPPVSCQMTYFSAVKKPTLLDAIRVAFDDPSTADLKIEVDGHVIHAHRAILKMRCSYFRTRFGDIWTEASGSSIEIKDFPYPTVRAFLIWLYTDELIIEPDDAVGLLELADCYVENGLKMRCANLLQKSITVDNAAFMYAAAVRWEVPHLEEHCFHFCLNHMTAVTQSDAFRKLDDGTIKQLICRAAREGIFKR